MYTKDRILAAKDFIYLILWCASLSCIITVWVYWNVVLAILYTIIIALPMFMIEELFYHSLEETKT